MYRMNKQSKKARDNRQIYQNLNEKDVFKLTNLTTNSN